MNHTYNDPNRKLVRQDHRQNLSKPEQILWYYLRSAKLGGYKFRRQYGVGLYTLDFYCAQVRLAVEVDGDSHYTDGGKRHDVAREAFLNQRNIRCIRFTNRDIMENIFGVLSAIKSYLT